MPRSRNTDINLALHETQSNFHSVRTRAGLLINTEHDVWAIRDNASTVRIDHSRYPATKRVSRSAKRVFAHDIENLAASTVQHTHSYLMALLQHEEAHLGQPVDEITGESILRYRATLAPKSGNRLRRIHGFLRRWHEMALPALSHNALEVFDQMVFPRDVNGAAILTMDPTLGPFTAIEAGTIHAALEEAYGDSRMILEDYIIAAIFPLLGQRPVQYASLKVCDFHKTEPTESQPSEYFLNVPRAKQRGQAPRSEFKLRRLNRQFGHRLALHVEDVTKRFSQKLKDPSQAPLFPARREVENAPPGWEYHRTASNLSKACRTIYKAIPANSERTESPINICPIRFRRTVGTRAAEAGHGELVIAELLDHKDTKSVSVYVEATATIRDRIDHAVATQLAPLVRAFRGSLRRNHTDDKSHGDSVATIVDPRFDPDLRPMGGCAHHGPCNLLAPLECYTCAYYRPWATAPHENVLDYLLRERQRLYDTRAPRVAAMFDRTILAVAEVVNLAKSVNQAREADG